MTTLPTLSAAVIESGRVVLRKARDADREGIVEVMTDPEVRAYLGGPRPREAVEQFLDTAGAAGATAAVGSAWGAGLAFEAAAAALRAAAGELPGQPVLVVTQAANDRARRLAGRLGFQEVDQFEEFDAKQVLAVASLARSVPYYRCSIAAPRSR